MASTVVSTEPVIEPIPVSPLLDQKVFEAERERIFKRTWLKVAREEEIPNPGDYKVKRIDIARTSVIIVRTRSGAIRAFHNICTHRGNKVIPEAGPEAMGETFGRARANVLTCRFHGWVFSTDGELKSVPDESEFPELEKGCLGLIPVSCETWEGFIFINLAQEPETSLGGFLNGIGKHFAGYPYSESKQSFRYATVLKCNWKIALFAFSESYHVPTIHENTIPSFAKFEHRDFKVFGPHSTSALHAEIPGMSGSPASDLFGGTLKNSPVHGPRPQDLPSAVNPERRNSFQFEFPNFFPNFLIHLCAGYAYPGMTFFTHQFWPLSVDETLWEGINYFRPPANAAEAVAQRHINALHRNAWLEDTGTMEDTHDALCASVLDSLQLMNREFMIGNTVRHWKRRVGLEEGAAP